MLPEGKCRYIDGQIYPDGNFYVLDTEHIKHNGNELKSALNTISTDVSNKVDKVSGKGLSTEDYTTAEKNKLSGIADNANNYVHPTTSGNKHIPSGGSSGKILGWSADGEAAWVDPSGGGGGGGSVETVFIDSTEYAPDANGKVTLPAYPTSLPASDVYSWAKAATKPTYTYSEVGAAASSHTHSGYVPTSRTVNGYALSSNVSLDYSDVGAASSGHSHSNATTSLSGFMSYSDKSKLNGIDNNANYYTHPTGAGNKHIPSGGSSGQFLKYSSSGTATWATPEISDVGLKYKDYQFNLTSAFTKTSAGMYYQSKSVSSDFTTLLSVTIANWSNTPNASFVPYLNPSALTVGLMLSLYGETASSKSFSNGTIWVRVLGIK